MARDYKHTPRQTAKAANRYSVLPFLTGLSIGLFVALLVYLWEPRGIGSAPGETDIHARPMAASPDETGQEAVAAPDTPKPRFDFYTILPEMEVKVPDWKLSRSKEAPDPEIEPGAYVFQVGSFQKYQDADRAKAQLALTGISANIQRVVINGQDVWYRVRIGPFTDAAELQDMRARLVERELDFMLLRIKSDGA